jgi:hypothetical protein
MASFGTQFASVARGGGRIGQKVLRYLAVREVLTVLALDGLHLVFQAQFKLLKPDFFQLFVVGEVTLVGKG